MFNGDSSLDYYVYAYLRKSDHTPYYIGKGIDDRAWNKGHSVSLPTNKHLIVILEENLTELGALALERRYIHWYGRKDNKTGILRNLTDGGEGHSGAKHRPNTIIRMKAVRTGISWDAMYGTKRAAEMKKQRAVSVLGLFAEDKNPRYDHTLYQWFHRDYGIIQSTRYQLIKNYPELNRCRIGDLAKNKIQQYKGWQMNITK